MKLKDIMTHDVKVISPGATLKDAAQMMDDIDVGALPVCDGEQLVGIITDRDIIIRSISAGQDPNTTPVRSAMTSPVTYCFDDNDVEQAAKLFQDKQIRRIAVLNHDKRLVGMISLGDLAVKGDQKEVTAEVTEKVSEPVKGESGFRKAA
jgi:CBS domain-containing protein